MERFKIPIEASDGDNRATQMKQSPVMQLIGFLPMASLLLIIVSALSGCMAMHARGHGDGHEGTPSRAACPVCGTELKVGKRTPRASHAGRLYYFAGEEHLREFIKAPARYPDRAPDQPMHDGGAR